jgi:hypothetical protein
MTEDELDEATFEKIRCAAEEIKDMARVRPENAPAMLAQAHHLIELAEQIRTDRLRRQGIGLHTIALTPRPDGHASLRNLDASETDRGNARFYPKAPSLL